MNFETYARLERLRKWESYARRVASTKKDRMWDRTVQSLEKRQMSLMLSELNTIRVAEGKPPLKAWKKSKAALEELLKSTGVTFSKGETVVADGAYKNDREAEARTGFTTHGKTKTRAKIELQRERYASKQAATTTPKHSKSALANLKPKAREPMPRTKERIPSNSLTLGDIAKALGIEPKKARAKYRKDPKPFVALEIATRLFPANKRKAVEALLKGRLK